jgi:predicted transcriptional regulator
MKEDESCNGDDINVGMLVSSTEGSSTEVVTIDDTPKLARTLMITTGFDRLLVMDKRKPPWGKQNVRGLISWKSLGKYASETNTRVEDIMDRDPHFVGDTTDLSQVSDIIFRREHVVVHRDSKIIGTVSVADYAAYLTKLTLPFYYLRQIELELRSILKNAGVDAVENPNSADLPAEKARECGNESKKLHELTLYELWSAAVDEKNWKKIGTTIDRVRFRKQLQETAELRNVLLHFRPPNEGSADIIDKLKRMRKTIQVMGRQTKNNKA